MKKSYHYTECGLSNVFLLNEFKWIKTARGRAVAIQDMDGLHQLISLLLVAPEKDLSGEEIRFLRHELLMSQKTFSQSLGVSIQIVHRLENGTIPEPSAPFLFLKKASKGWKSAA
jgi:putative transcriptional regulator